MIKKIYIIRFFHLNININSLWNEHFLSIIIFCSVIKKYSFFISLAESIKIVYIFIRDELNINQWQIAIIVNILMLNIIYLIIVMIMSSNLLIVMVIVEECVILPNEQAQIIMLFFGCGIVSLKK